MEWVGVLGDSYLLTGSCLRPDKISSTSIESNLQDYLLAVRMDSSTYNKVLSERSGFYHQYLPQKSFSEKSYFTIARFSAKEWMEDTLIRWMQRVCSRIRSFNITLNNYSGSPAHCIYLRVMDIEPFRQLAQELKIINEYLRSNNCQELHFLRPCVSIAQELPEAVYEKAMRDYSEKLFCESFTAKEIVLIRNAADAELCKTINVFGLMPGENDLFN